MLVVERTSLAASICRESYSDFLREFWDEFVPQPAVWNWHIPLLCDELQTVAERVFVRKPKEYDLIINISPGSSKSITCTEAFPVWCWIRDQKFRTICGSFADELSLYLAGHSYRLLTSEKFRRMFPEVELVKAAVKLLETKQGGWRYATSTGGSVTGKHAHMQIVDDPLDPKGAISDAILRTANNWMDETLPSRAVDKQVTPLVLIMQRLAQGDSTGNKLAKQEDGTPIRHICLPAELTDDVRPRSLRSKYIDGLFDPVRLPRSVLDKVPIDQSEFVYAGQYLQRPVPREGGSFRIEHIRVIPSPPKMRRVVRYWDKAGSGGRGAWTVGVKMGETQDGTFCIMDVERGQWEAAERERRILQTAQRDGRHVAIYVEQEPGSGGKESAQATVKNLRGFKVQADRPVGDKVARADPFAVQVNGGNVTMVAGPWNKTYLSELEFFPLSKFKDQVDASSGGFAMLTGRRLVVGAL